MHGGNQLVLVEIGHPRITLVHRRENNDADTRGLFFEFKAREGSGARSVTAEERRNREKRPRSSKSRERSEPFPNKPIKKHLYWYFRDVAVGTLGCS